MPNPEPYMALSVIHATDQSPEWIFELFDVEGIEKTEEGSKAYWAKKIWSNIESKLISELKDNGFEDFRIEKVPFVNWNAEWEANFQPIRIKDFCLIRAPFHKPSDAVRYEIVIDPKMAFGTGHHATTWQMIDTMSHLDFANKSVLDYGSGTGILSILAYKMGAKPILAIDNDAIAVDNMKENFMINKCVAIEGEEAILEELDDTTYNVILANINRNVLLESDKGISKRAAARADLLMSGFYARELALLIEKYRSEWTLIGQSVKEDWCCAHFRKK